MKKWFWIILCVNTLIIRQILKNYPNVVEEYYSRGIFIWIRYFFDKLGSITSFSVACVLIIFLVYFKFIRKIREFTFSKNSILQASLSLLNLIAGLLFFFLILWGFNYLRLPLAQNIGLENMPLNISELSDELDFAKNEVVNIKLFMLNNITIPDNYVELIKRDVTQKMTTWGLYDGGNPPVRILSPKGILLHFSTSGIYFPFTGECNIDGGLHPLQIPYTLAHEIAHGLGFTNEGDCNFIAYAATQNSDNQYIKYSAALNYYREVAAQYKSYEPEKYRAFRKKLPPEIIADLDEINAKMIGYKDWFPEVRDFTYDTFLKSQGIKEGLKSYSTVIALARFERLQCRD